MIGHRPVIAMALTLLGLCATGEAQTPLLVPGVRVRVTGPCLVDAPSGPAQCAVVIGRLRSWTPDSVIVQQGSGGDRAVARRAARLVEVSDGTKSQKTLGTLVGMGVGLAAGLAYPCTPENKSSNGSQSLDYFGCTLIRMVGVAVGLGVGAGVGRIVGVMIKSETWVSLAGDIATVGITPQGHAGLGLTFNVRF